MVSDFVDEIDERDPRVARVVQIQIDLLQFLDMLVQRGQVVSRVALHADLRVQLVLVQLPPEERNRPTDLHRSKQFQNREEKAVRRKRGENT